MSLFKKIISCTVSSALILSLSLPAFAADNGLATQSSEESSKANIKYLYKINEPSNQQESEKVYKELGIYDLLQKIHAENARKGLTLKSEEIYIENSTNNTSMMLSNNANSTVTPNSTVLDTVNLPNCNGYSMRYVNVRDIYNGYPEVDLMKKTNGVVDCLNAGFSVLIGYADPWVWIPCTLLGIQPFNMFQDSTRTPKLLENTAETYTYKMFEIYTDNKEWIANSYSMKSDVTVSLHFQGWDKNLNVVTKDSNTKKTVLSTYYNDNSYMSLATYNAYKGKAYEVHDRTPYMQDPQVVSHN